MGLAAKKKNKSKKKGAWFSPVNAKKVLASNLYPRKKKKKGSNMGQMEPRSPNWMDPKTKSINFIPRIGS